MNSTLPTVLLVHGAFADGSSWRGVIAELQGHDIPVRAWSIRRAVSVTVPA